MLSFKKNRELPVPWKKCERYLEIVKYWNEKQDTIFYVPQKCEDNSLAEMTFGEGVIVDPSGELMRRAKESYFHFIVVSIWYPLSFEYFHVLVLSNSNKGQYCFWRPVPIKFKLSPLLFLLPFLMQPASRLTNGKEFSRI